MKGLALALVTALVSLSCQNANNKTQTAKPPSELHWLQQWIGAWEFMSDHMLYIPHDSAPEMLFFDSVHVFTTSNVSAPNGTAIEGPDFFDQKLHWKKMPHNGELTLPDGQKVSVGLMSFAGPAKDGKSFFVMAAPSFWASAGVKSDELGLEKLITGVFLHEFSHIRQFKGFGRQIDSLWSKHSFGDTSLLSDDIVQYYFKADSQYVRDFREETEFFYEAWSAGTAEEMKRLIRSGLERFHARQEKYFTGEKAVLKDLDNIFLSMEGAGQMLGVLWLTHPEGGNVLAEVAVKGFRRKRNQWSQDEGLGMFLALIATAPPNWSKEIFSDHPANIIDLLKKAAN